MTETSEWYRGWLITRERGVWRFCPPGSDPNKHDGVRYYAGSAQGCKEAIDRRMACAGAA